MRNDLSYTLTSESAIVLYKGKTYTISKGTVNFEGLKKAILEDREADIPNYLTVKKGLEAWAQGKFEFNEAREVFSYANEDLPREINSRIIAMATAGEDPTPLLRFYERLQNNPSMRSVEQLYRFLNNAHIPIDKDGFILPYKGVTKDYLDQHTKTVDNKPGVVNEMPRNKISDDPRVECHYGYHVGALSYARSFSDIVVICKVDPADVVCVPYDYRSQKMRVCKYVVIGNYGGTPLPSTSIEDEDIPSQVEEEEEVEGEDDPQEVAQPAALREVAGVKVAKKYEKYIDMDLVDLMKLSIETLREFATHGLKMVGASKVRGGKKALADQILRTISGEKSPQENEE